MTLAIGVDIGGTKASVGVVDASGQILQQRRLPVAPHDPDGTLALVIDAIKELRVEHEVAAVGIGVPGLLDADRSRVEFAANLGWVDVPVRDVVETRTQLPSTLVGDANAAAWAEYRFGAARDEPHLVMVTVGTGIGGAIIDHGSVLHGASGSAADVGHMQIVPDGVECTCGGRGCLEQYASGRALVTKAREKCLSAPSQAALVLSLGDQTPEGIRGDHLTEAARRGDPLALECFEFIASWLGHGLSVLTAVLDPGCVVLGGGVSDAGNLLLEPTSAAYQRALPARDHRSPARLKLAQLGNDAGLIGAAHLAQAH